MVNRLKVPSKMESLLPQRQKHPLSHHQAVSNEVGANAWEKQELSGHLLLWGQFDMVPQGF